LYKEFYKYATDKIKKEKQENQVAKENNKTKQKQDLPALRRSQRTKLFFNYSYFLNNIINII